MTFPLTIGLELFFLQHFVDMLMFLDILIFDSKPLQQGKSCERTVMLHSSVTRYTIF